MNPVSFQIAFFFLDPVARPDQLGLRINARLNNMFDRIPKINDLPMDAPRDIPVVQMTSSTTDSRCNISRGRTDFFINPEVLSKKSLAKFITENERLIFDFIEAVFDEGIAVNRVGLVLSAFEKKEDASEYVIEKYFFNRFTKVSEAYLRINRMEKIDKLNINNIIEVSDGILKNEKLGINDRGIVFKRDINSNIRENVALSTGQIKEIWKYAIQWFTNKKMGEVQ